MIHVGDLVGYRTASRRRQRVARVREIETHQGQTLYRVLKRTRTHWLAEVEPIDPVAPGWPGHSHEFHI